MTDLHIVTGSDDNYAAGVLVLIASAAWHNPDARFSVLDMDISQANRDRIDALAAELRIRVDRIQIDVARLAALPVVRAHLTRSTFLRLLIPDLMPDASRVVYMDCDMAVTGSLAELAKVDLADRPIAAVPDPSPDALELAATGTRLGDYVNAGLLVMNLPVWRAEGVAAACVDLLSDPASPLRAEDQSAVNIACKGRILKLDPRYNVFTDPAAWTPASLPAQVSVAHYVVNQKPWRANPRMAEIWRFHADRIAALMPPRSPLSLKTRLSALNRNRRVWVGYVMGRQKYRDRVRVAALMQTRFVKPYLAEQAAKGPSRVSGR